MHKLTHKIKELGGRRIAFSLVVLVYLGFLGFINVMMFLPGNWMSAMGHFDFFYTGDTHDLVHELVFALVIGTAAVGLLSQLWKPKENFAGQLVALFAWVAMILIAALTNNWVPQPLFIIFGGLTILATILHPAGRSLFNWLSAARINRTLLALVIIAAVPLTVLAFTNIGLQLGGRGAAGFFDHSPPAFHGGVTTDQESSQDQLVSDTNGMPADDQSIDGQKHAALGHYRNIAVLSFITILMGLLASFRPKGWRFAAWVAGFLPILFGFASVVLLDAESSLGFTWGLAAIAWGFVFIVVAEVTWHKELKEAREL